MSFRGIDVYDLASIPDYSELPGVLTEVVEGFDSANQAYEELEQKGLMDLFAETSPNSYDTLHQTHEELKLGLGVLILRNTHVEKVDDQTAQLLSITLASMYGQPTRTDRKLSQIAWPVKYDPDAAVVRTFSQALGEAAYHTDTQYFKEPEDYFGLFCIVSDKPGNGTNRLLHIDDIIGAFDRNTSDRTLDVLTSPYPFRVPSVFTRSGLDSEVEVVWAPIIDVENNTIRYRRDTIASALKVPGVELSGEQHTALEKLESVLATITPLEHHLKPGESIIVHNKKLLHSRTTFDNPNRFLYRVRMKEDI